MEEDRSNFDYFLYVHKQQLLESNIPEKYWKSLHQKLSDRKYDIGKYYTGEIEVVNTPLLVACESGISVDDKDCICMIDHAFTFTLDNVMEKLTNTRELAENLCSMLKCIRDIPIAQIAQEGLLRSEIIKRVFKTMWLYAHHYNVKRMQIEDGHVKSIEKNVYENVTNWFIPGAIGCHLRHSDDPNTEFKCFYYTPDEKFYSVLYPTRNLKNGEVITCNFIPHQSSNANHRDAQLYPWLPERLDLSAIKDDWLNKAKDFERKAMRVNPESKDTQLTFFKGKGIKVFTDSNVIKKHLTDDRFTITDNISEANILWITPHLSDLDSLCETPDLLVSQFPNEKVLVCKDLLSEVIRRTVVLDNDEALDNKVMLNRGPLWYKTTFDLKTELPEFIKYAVELQEKTNRNDITWICKRWNLARGIGHVISNNINEIIRISEGEPRIVSRYIEDPVLFKRDDVGLVKFDLRYMVSVVSIQPLIAYAYDVFYTRFANKEFSLDDFHDYETHFTVMNYRDDAALLQIHDKDFIKMFDAQYPSHPWKDIEDKIYDCIWKVLRVVSEAKEPHGIGHNPQCRAVYGFDFMVEWTSEDHTEMCPVMLECNLNPSIERPSLYETHLANDLFRTLFLGETKDCHHSLLPRSKSS